MNCRFCQHPLKLEFVDLNHSPPSNSFLSTSQLGMPEVTYPLKLFVCEACWLVQIDEHKDAEEIFNQDYIYFSSFSSSWLAHAREYVEKMIKRLALNAQSSVIEVASNDGYLLQYFKEKNIPCLGIEPTHSTAVACREKDIVVIEDFFGKKLARKLQKEKKKADLILGNNVFAHVPDINDFVGGLKNALKPTGTITLEFPHLMQLVLNNQFDTIYHEHFSYLSLYTTAKIFEAHGLRVYDVEELGTHGGSLRIYGCHEANPSIQISQSVSHLLSREKKMGMQKAAFYKCFSNKVTKIKLDLLTFLIQQKQAGKKVIAYGAAAKGNTLLNYCGIHKDLLPAVVDLSPHKVGKYLPGVHIPVMDVSILKKEKPDYVLILPWNIQEEVMAQHSYISKWGGRFVVPIPELQVL